MAVARLANVAVLGEAPEDLEPTLIFLDRAGNFFASLLASTLAGWRSEQAPQRRQVECEASGRGAWSQTHSGSACGPGGWAPWEK
jgi:hypothetical protein